MTGPSPWAAPPETGPQQAPVPPQPGQFVPPMPPQPPRRRLPWLLLGGAVMVLITAIAATAAITYAVTRNTGASNTTQATATPTPDQSQFSETDQAAAKQHVCGVFDAATRGLMSQGPIRTNGEPNLLVVVRALNAVQAVQNAVSPAVPADLAKAVRSYADAVLAVTSGATNGMPTDEFNRLNSTSNDATYAVADLCGLPH
jgi:hypothetical protein